MMHIEVHPRVKFWLRLVFSLIILAILIPRLDLLGAWNTVRSAKWEFLTLSLICAAAARVLFALEWRLILTTHKTNINLLDLVRLDFVGYFFSMFVPSSIGGDLARGYLIGNREARRDWVASVSIVTARLINLYALLLLGLAGLVLSAILGEARHPVLWVIGIFSVGPALFLVGFLGLARLASIASLNPGLGRRPLRKLQKLQELVASLTQYRPALLVSALMLAVATQICKTLSVAMVAFSVGTHLSVWPYLVVVPAVFLIVLVPVSLNGMGIRESSYVHLLQRVGEQAGVATAVAMIQLLYVLGYGLLGAILYMMPRREAVHTREA